MPRADSQMVAGEVCAPVLRFGEGRLLGSVKATSPARAVRVWVFRWGLLLSFASGCFSLDLFLVFGGTW
jgi:hypothetical protein